MSNRKDDVCACEWPEPADGEPCPVHGRLMTAQASYRTSMVVHVGDELFEFCEVGVVPRVGEAIDIHDCDQRHVSRGQPANPARDHGGVIQGVTWSLWVDERGRGVMTADVFVRTTDEAIELSEAKP